MSPVIESGTTPSEDLFIDTKSSKSSPSIPTPPCIYKACVFSALADRVRACICLVIVPQS